MCSRFVEVAEGAFCGGRQPASEAPVVGEEPVLVCKPEEDPTLVGGKVIPNGRSRVVISLRGEGR